MRRAIALLLIMLVIIITAYVSKPSDEKCISEAKIKFNGKLENTIPSLPNSVNKDLFRATMKKAFTESLVVEDKVLYKEIYEQKEIAKTKIGWGAIGVVTIDLK